MTKSIDIVSDRKRKTIDDRDGSMVVPHNSNDEHEEYREHGVVSSSGQSAPKRSRREQIQRSRQIYEERKRIDEAKKRAQSAAANANAATASHAHAPSTPSSSNPPGPVVVGTSSRTGLEQEASRAMSDGSVDVKPAYKQPSISTTTGVTPCLPGSAQAHISVPSGPVPRQMQHVLQSTAVSFSSQSIDFAAAAAAVSTTPFVVPAPPLPPRTQVLLHTTPAPVSSSPADSPPALSSLPVFAPPLNCVVREELSNIRVVRGDESVEAEDVDGDSPTTSTTTRATPPTPNRSWQQPPQQRMKIHKSNYHENNDTTCNDVAEAAATAKSSTKYSWYDPSRGIAPHMLKSAFVLLAGMIMSILVVWMTVRHFYGVWNHHKVPTCFDNANLDQCLPCPPHAECGEGLILSCGSPFEKMTVSTDLKKNPMATRCILSNDAQEALKRVTSVLESWSIASTCAKSSVAMSENNHHNGPDDFKTIGASRLYSFHSVAQEMKRREGIVFDHEDDESQFLSITRSVSSHLSTLVDDDGVFWVGLRPTHTHHLPFLCRADLFMAYIDFLLIDGFIVGTLLMSIYFISRFLWSMAKQ